MAEDEEAAQHSQAQQEVQEDEDIEKASLASDSFIDDGDDDNEAAGEEEDLLPEEHLTEQEIEELIAELLEVESKAAEAQEALEEESLAKVEADVRAELTQTLSADELESAVADEMKNFKQEWESELDELETESAQLLEQLDGAGIELPSLYKWIESQAPNSCCTEAWKRRTQWVGSQVTSDLSEAVVDAEKYLDIHRPVRKKHGKILEEGASGFLGRKLVGNDGCEGLNTSVDWSSFNKMCSDKSSLDNVSFGSKQWASVYLASTPQQAAELGLNFPGVDEVEEIDDIEDDPIDAFVVDDLSEEQKRKFRKVKEEDDVKIDKKLQRHLKQHRNRRKSFISQETTEQVSESYENGSSYQDLEVQACGSSVFEVDKEKCNGDSSVVEARGSKRQLATDESDAENRKRQAITIDSDDEDLTVDRSSQPCGVSDMVDQCNSQDYKTDMVHSNSLPMMNENKIFRCTACDEVAKEVHRHPLLDVIVCMDCKTLMVAKMKDVDCSECYCRWCGRSSDLLSCRLCKTLFCSLCIQRNLGEEFLSGVKASGWQCCCCSPSILKNSTLALEKAIESQGLAADDSSSDSDSDNSDAGPNLHAGTRRRHKKKIRRILDDTELGEETKRKIAIEKERQERLKSLEAQFSSKARMMSFGDSSTKSYENGSVEMLGDAKTGYVVNVVRDEGEEAVRIPPSMSAKLKSHQVAGIRFMWENIIQSIKNVKSGDKGLGCILAHTMGLGKTFQVIAFLYAAMRCVDLGLRTALIVTPVSVLHNWRHEFMKWRPTELKPLRVFMLEDVPRERRAELLQKWRSKGGVFLIGYSAFRNLSLGKHIKDRQIARDICQSLQDGPDILVCDEAHIIKNTRADVTQALKQVKCQRRIALTGSPLQNNLMEYYCMVDFVREGFLGSSHEFRNRFQNPIEYGQHTNCTAEDVKIMNQRSHILYEQLKGFVQRMDMNVVKKDLPPKTVFVVSVKLSPLQRKLYKRFLDVHGFTKDKVTGEKIRKRSFFAGYQALAQIWNHPGILQLMKENRDAKREDAVENFIVEDCSSDENADNNVIPSEKPNNNGELPLRKDANGFLRGDWWSDLLKENSYKEVDYSGKMVLLLEILTMCANFGDKVLVFSQNLATLDLIELYLSKFPRSGKKGKFWKQGKDWFRLDGRTESSLRQKIVERFNEPHNRRVKCTLISTKAGSLGINLHAANRVIIVDGSWNPTYDLQAIYRVWRYGQTKPVYAYRLLAHGTMEEKIYKRQVTKEGLAARVVDRQQVHRTISREEMLHLFEFGDDDGADVIPDLGELNTVDHVGSFLRQKLPLPNGSVSSDKFMQTLIDRHHPRWLRSNGCDDTGPCVRTKEKSGTSHLEDCALRIKSLCIRWIAHYHEHETLLQENEDEKLSKEEQEMAWEVYRRSLEWEEVQRVSPDESTFERHQLSQNGSATDRKPPISNKPPPARENRLTVKLAQIVEAAKNKVMVRKCTNLSHMLTLRYQGVKTGCTTVCGECAQEIGWDKLKP